jgi:serine/threonine-protein kinase
MPVDATTNVYVDDDTDTEVEIWRADAGKLEPAPATPPVRLVTSSPAPRRPRASGGCGLNYRLVRQLARGATGVVYEAMHVHLGRPVAIKFLKPDLLSDERIVYRFLAEGRAMALTPDRASPVVHDFGQDPAGHAYLIMERLVGETLAARMGRGAIPLEEALSIGAGIAAALAAAHSADVIHRDLRPENAFLTRKGPVKLIDFGLALAAREPREPFGTQVGSLVGTPTYMSPEQTFSLAVSPKTDVYALGCLLYELVLGYPPFSGTDADVIDAHRHRPPPDPRTVGINPPLALLILAMLAKEPDARPTAAEVADRLQSNALATETVKTSARRAAARAPSLSEPPASFSGEIGDSRTTRFPRVEAPPPMPSGGGTTAVVYECSGAALRLMAFAAVIALALLAASLL